MKFALKSFALLVVPTLCLVFVFGYTFLIKSGRPEVEGDTTVKRGPDATAKNVSIVTIPTISTKVTNNRAQKAGTVTDDVNIKENYLSYPLHSQIYTSVFWVGEMPSADNAYITNTESAWYSDWQKYYGGYDDPNNRNGYWPAGFKSKENPFYFALPYGDYTEKGLKDNIEEIYWYRKIRDGESLLKNRWIKISSNGKIAYAQWEDVGPFEENDVGYVFGNQRPRQRVGLDVSPAVSTYLGFSGITRTSWQFVDAGDVPPGPWKEIITTSNPKW